MLVKDADSKHQDYASLNALLARPDLSPKHRQAVAKQIDNTRTGEQGEREVAYFLNQGLRDNPNTLVVHDLRLEVDGLSAQIDHLVISRYRLAYVLETKNLNASLHCNEDGEWTAWYGPHGRGTPYPIASPIEQARRHVEVLRRWFEINGWQTIKHIEPVVVVSPTTFVAKTRAKGDEHVAVVRSDLFRRWWEHDRDIGSPVGSLWLFASRYSTEQLAALGAALLAAHQPASRNWAAQLGITQPVPQPPAVASEDHGRSSSIAGTGTPPITRLSQILTPFGIVRPKRVTDGRFALRHDDDESLAAHVKIVGEEFGSWQPRFRNWLVYEKDLPQVVGLLEGAAGAIQSEASI
jgi:hypothetical protein